MAKFLERFGLVCVTAKFSSVSTEREWKQKTRHEQLCSLELEVRILDCNRVTQHMREILFFVVSTCMY